MLFSHAYALKPAELHPVRNKINEDASVISTSSSTFAKLHGIPPRAVNLCDGFWKKRFTVNMERGIPTFFTLLNNVGARDKLLDRKNKARRNSDADLAKWVEAASFVLQSEDNKQLRNVLQTVVNDIMISGTNGGYLHSRYFEKMPARLAQFRASGDLYCLGHLIQAGIAHYRATADKPFLSTEICINNSRFQHDSYRLAFTMGQLYHKNLAMMDASVLMYCWLLLNGPQPTFDATRSLFRVDRGHSVCPTASSHQLLVFGSFSRKLLRGTKRVGAVSSDGDLLVTAFTDGTRRVVIMLNRGVYPQKVKLTGWPAFSRAEVTDPYNENRRLDSRDVVNEGGELVINGGQILTLF